MPFSTLRCIFKRYSAWYAANFCVAAACGMGSYCALHQAASKEMQPTDAEQSQAQLLLTKHPGQQQKK